MHRRRINFSDVTIVVRKEPPPGQRQHQPRAALRNIGRRPREKNDPLRKTRQALEHRLVIGGFRFGRIRPEREIKTADPWIQFCQLLQSRAADARHSIAFALFPKEIRVAAQKENPGRGEFARNHPRKIRTENWKKTRLHRNTL